MAGTPGISWDSCKIIEEQENGELKLLTENLTQLITHLNKPEFRDIPLVLLSITGENQSGKSFYTNLMAEYLKYNGKLWTKTMKEEGLNGFAFGTGETRVSGEKVDGIFEPGELELSGVYFWPELFLLEQCNGKKLLWIMHMYHGKRGDSISISEGPVTNFVKVVSSRLVDIVWKDESVPEKLQESVEQRDISSYICQSVVYLVRGMPANQLAPEDINETSTVTQIPESSKPFHDENGVVNLAMRQHSIEKFIKAAINEQDLKPGTFRKDSSAKSIALTLNLVESKLKGCVDLINSKRKSSSSSVCVKNEVTPDLQQNAATTSTSSELISKLTEEIRLEDKVKDVTNESKINSDTSTSSPNQLKSEVKPDYTSQHTNECVQLNSQDKLLSKYLDEEYFSSRIWKLIRKALKTWIHRKLTCKNVGEMIDLNEIATRIADKKIENLIRKGVPSEEAAKVIPIAKVEENVLKFKLKIESLQNGLVKFCSEIDAHFQNTPYFPEPELHQIMEQIKTKIKDSLQFNDFSDLFDAGCKKLIPEFVEHNAKIEKEAKLVLECNHQIVTFYQEEMFLVLKQEKFQFPANLQNIHNQLVKKLHQVFEDSVGENPSALENLCKLLDKEFQTIRQKNMEKIASVQRRLSSLIMQMKSDYEIEMDALLEANEDGVESSLFDAEHEKAKVKVTEKFKELLVLEVRLEEPVDKHLKTLAAHMNNSRESFEEENEVNLKASKEKAVQSKTEEKTVAVHSQPIEPAQDQPLFFHLTYSKIGVGFRADSFGDQNISYVPALIGLTTSKEWVTGEDYVKAATENCFEGRWEIGEYFRTSHNHRPGLESAPYEIDTGNGKLKITLQFLLAIFFACYKSKLEQFHKLNFSTAMIAVPFWFPSSQRQQVLEATQIAGFESAKLFNENSSAAYFMYSNGFISSNSSNQWNALIISENSNRVDMSLYLYNKRTGKLKLKGHTGDYEEDLKKVSGGAQTWPMVGELITFLNAIHNKINPKSAEENAVKKLREKLANMRIHSCEVVIFTETTEWIPLLGKVGDKVSPYAIRDNSRFAILGLASIFEAIQNDGQELGDIIEDGIPFYLNIYPPNGGTRKEMQRKSGTFAENPKFTVEATLGVSEGAYKVIQENSSWKMPVGLLTIKNYHTTEYTHITVFMERTLDGIFELQKVECLHITMTNFTKMRREMDSDEYRWEAGKMSTDKLNRYAFYLNSIYPNSGKLAKLKDLKEKAISCAQQLEKAIVAEGKGSFPIEMVKALALNSIREAGRFLEDADISEDDVKQKSNILERLKRDYKIL